MNITEKTVFQALDKSRQQGITIRELLVELRQRKNKKTQLRKTLRKLTQKKICFKRDNRYFLKIDAASQTIKIKGFKGKRKRSQRDNDSTQSHYRHPNGIYLFENRRGIIHSFKNNQNYSLHKEGINYLFPGDTVNFSLIGAEKDNQKARVDKIVRRKIKYIWGRLDFNKKNQPFVTPHNHNFPGKFNVLNTSIKKTTPHPENVLLEITRYPEKNREPEGKIDFSLSSSTQAEKKITHLLLEKEIPLTFSSKLLKAEKYQSKTVRLNPYEKRQDLRELPFVTIDGSDAKDFDDAIFAKEEGKNFRLWVSIADVAEYVPGGSELDKAAYLRGTSTYLPGIAYPMLPEYLSNGLCSLKEKVNRKTLTCEMLLDENGEVLDVQIYQSINRIVCQLTYAMVDAFFATGSIRKKPTLIDLKKSLPLYRKIALILRKKRLSRGMIDFSLPETAFSYDQENQISDIRKKYQTEAERLIEQFMLEANENVGKFCATYHIPILWRNHPPPLPAKENDLKALFWRHDIDVPALKSAKSYNLALQQIKNSPYQDILEYSLLRSMSIAEYGVNRKGHFGLSATHYCHFTSPIRRYPDLLIHRALRSYWHRGKKVLIHKKIAANVTECEQKATSIERKVVKFRKMLFISNRLGETFQVKVSGLHWRGLFVEIDHPYVEGFVSFESIYDDRYDYNEEKNVIVGKKHYRKIVYGDKLNVLLSGLDWSRMSPEFEWISWIKTHSTES